MYISEKNTREKEKMTDISCLSVEQKIGQLFVLRPEAMDEEYTTRRLGTRSVSAYMREKIARYQPGGFCIFNQNIRDEEQLLGFTANLHACGGIRPFLCIDEEGGNTSRIAQNGSFPVPVYESMGAVGDTGDPAKACEAGHTIGTYLKKYGFDGDLAPVADVNTNPENIIIGRRAFGNDPEKAALMVSAFTRGIRDAGIACCLKHFPGHGDTRDDTHKCRVCVSKTWDEMKQCEMIPFRAGIQAGADMVMSAHITALNVCPEGLPSTLSRTLLTEKLRQEMGFGGVIITDALEMRAIRDHYPDGESAVLAFLAGADILLMPLDFEAAYEGMLAAVRSGRVSAERLDQSVKRILRMKKLL
ncbi:MAG: hypothetical protein CW338_05310 [Clostridiales bacterium]|nr:hypothetical protein [Clostridiales bacterium]